MNKTQALRTLLSPDYMIKEVVEVHRLIRRHIREAPDKAFKTYWDPTSRKFLVAVDLLAEQLFINAVTARCGHENVRVDGEESLNENLNLQQETRTCVLVDMIDRGSLHRPSPRVDVFCNQERWGIQEASKSGHERRSGHSSHYNSREVEVY
jgi:hypothetical protein